MTPYQIFVLAAIVVWPFVIMGLLFAMQKLDDYVARSDAATPEEAGLEPVAGTTSDREVRIVFGDHVVGEGSEEPQIPLRADDEPLGSSAP